MQQIIGLYVLGLSGLLSLTLAYDVPIGSLILPRFDSGYCNSASTPVNSDDRMCAEFVWFPGCCTCCGKGQTGWVGCESGWACDTDGSEPICTIDNSDATGGCSAAATTSSSPTTAPPSSPTTSVDDPGSAATTTTDDTGSTATSGATPGTTVTSGPVSGNTAASSPRSFGLKSFAAILLLGAL